MTEVLERLQQRLLEDFVSTFLSGFNLSLADCPDHLKKFFLGGQYRRLVQLNTEKKRFKNVLEIGTRYDTFANAFYLWVVITGYNVQVCSTAPIFEIREVVRISTSLVNTSFHEEFQNLSQAVNTTLFTELEQSINHNHQHCNHRQAQTKMEKARRYDRARYGKLCSENKELLVLIKRAWTS